MICVAGFRITSEIASCQIDLISSTYMYLANRNDIISFIDLHISIPTPIIAQARFPTSATAVTIQGGFAQPF